MLQGGGQPAHPGLPWGPRTAQRYQQARCEDKGPQPGPTNGVILGTTQARTGWAQAICHPLLHQHMNQVLNGGRHPSEVRRTVPRRWLGRNLLRATVSVPLVPPLTPHPRAEVQ